MLSFSHTDKVIGAEATLALSQQTSEKFFCCFADNNQSGANDALTPSVLVAQVRESPNIGQVHREADDGQQKVYFLSPSFSAVVRSGRSRPGGGARDDGGAGVLDPVLVLHQDQFHLLLLLIALFERRHRGELVLRHNLDVHLVSGALTAPQAPARPARLAWEMPIKLSKSRSGGCCPPRLQLPTPPLALAADKKGGERRE